MLTALMYRAEKLTFEPAAIKTAWWETGWYPFDGEKIMVRTRLETATVLPTVDDYLVDRVTSASSRAASAQADLRSELLANVTPVKVRKLAKHVGDPKLLVAEHKKREEAAVLAAAEKQERLVVREANAMVRFVEKAAKKQKVEAHTCLADGCNKIHRGGKDWVVCEQCERRACAIHKTQLVGHVCVDEEDE
jgi:hypothetical protein